MFYRLFIRTGCPIIYKRRVLATICMGSNLKLAMWKTFCLPYYQIIFKPLESRMQLMKKSGFFSCRDPTAYFYTLFEARSGVNWADLMAAQGAFGTDFYDRSTRTIVGMMLWTEYRPVIKFGLKCALSSHEIRPIHFAPSLGQSILQYTMKK